ncbi:class II aldolase/adducin family protein [Aquicoccus sp. SCR17]|nr:class II aldolase/adducin family protein [Carideicomes alvinocaridis]
MTDLAATVRMAARAVARAGLVHAYGHCSARIDADRFLVCPSKPMGLVQPGEPCIEVPVSGPLPEGVLGEVRLHQRIYAARPEAGGVVRFMGPSVMALGALNQVPRMRHGFGTYFHPGAGLWEDVQLVRDDALADGAFAAMGDSAGLIMKGNGAIVAGASLEEATMLAFYLDDACRIELAARAAGLAEAGIIPLDVAQKRATRAGGIVERMWDHMTDGDPERDVGNKGTTK